MKHRIQGMWLIPSRGALSYRAWIYLRDPLGRDKRSLESTYITSFQFCLHLPSPLTVNSASQAPWYRKDSLNDKHEYFSNWKGIFAIKINELTFRFTPFSYKLTWVCPLHLSQKASHEDCHINLWNCNSNIRPRKQEFHHPVGQFGGQLARSLKVSLLLDVTKKFFFNKK